MTAPEKFTPWDDPGATPLIRFQGVTKRFGAFTAIDNIDLDIYEQEFFALLGPSGCGKTTLMRMLAGFEAATEGTILLDDQDIAGVPPNKRATNMMFQSYALFPHLTVYDNIAFGLKRDKLPADRIRARTEEMIALVQLGQFGSRKPHQISGGQRQRVSVARALIIRPDIVLLDEPTSALDVSVQAEVLNLLMRLKRDHRLTYVLVSHNLAVIAHMCERLAVMQNGAVVETLSVEQLRKHTPAQPYTRQLLTASLGYDRAAIDSFIEF